MTDHTGVFNGRARQKEDGEFITVSFQRGGVQTVLYTLWASRNILDNIAGDPAMKGLSGESLYKALIRKRAYPSNAWKQPDGSLRPMPSSDEDRAGIRIEDIIPCLQKFYKREDEDDPLHGVRFLVKYSDHLVEDVFGLDDPLPGVAAEQETKTIIVDGQRYTRTCYIAHWRNGVRLSPESTVADLPRKAGEQAYYPVHLDETTGKIEGGGIMSIWHWENGKNVSVDGQPKFEKFDEAGHPLYLINQQDHTIITEKIDPDTGEVVSAYSTDENGRNRYDFTPEEIAHLPKPQLPSLG
jgi:hypothetical protein